LNQNIQRSLFDDPSPAPEGVDNEISLLALSDLRGVGFATVRTLFDAYRGDLSAVWSASFDELQQHLRLASIPQYEVVAHQIQNHSKKLFDHAREKAAFLQNRRKISILFKDTAAYPKALNALRDPPAWLFVQGNTSILHDPAIIAVIGTRTPSESGLEAARRASSSLARAGYVILSGLAEGIDVIGHQAAIDFGAPTIAILGHGTDVAMSAAATRLRQQIVELGGAVVSEYLPKDTYNRERFVARDRIQAALSQVIIVAEGRVKSGTAHTVRFARQIERTVVGVHLRQRPLPSEIDLIEELRKQSAPIFDLEASDGPEQFLRYMLKTLPVGEVSLRRTPPRLFLTAYSEIERLVRKYGAHPEDFEWLMRQIQALSSAGGSRDGDSGGHS